MAVFELESDVSRMKAGSDPTEPEDLFTLLLNPGHQRTQFFGGQFQVRTILEDLDLGDLLHRHAAEGKVPMPPFIGWIKAFTHQFFILYSCLTWRSRRCRTT